MSAEVDLEQYKIYSQDLSNIGVRHDSARSFYLSVVSAFLVLLSFADKDKALFSMSQQVQVVIGFVGIGLSMVWALHMQSFAALFRAKFEVLSELTTRMEAFDLYSHELAHLKRDVRYRMSKHLDEVVPLLFAVPFALLLRIRW